MNNDKNAECFHEIWFKINSTNNFVNFYKNDQKNLYLASLISAFKSIIVCTRDEGPYNYTLNDYNSYN